VNTIGPAVPDEPAGAAAIAREQAPEAAATMISFFSVRAFCAADVVAGSTRGSTGVRA
jgi:hypothetical protein